MSAVSAFTDEERLTFATHKPMVYFDFATFIKPLEPLVWLSMMLVLLLTSFTLYKSASYYEQRTGINLTSFAIFGNALWYCYGTFVGESITKEKNFKTKSCQSLRLAMAQWILTCFVISASYAGILKAFLTNPTYESSIETLVDILDSGLPWDMVLYGEEIERLMAESDDPVISKIWRDKGIAEYAYVDVERVLFKCLTHSNLN